jgi:N-acetylmuramoyl-L-alanine amidase
MAETYIARKNDCMASIAKKFGFGDYKIIYNHPQNAELKRKRPNPNLLVEGDKVFIPDKNLGEESCATEQKHRFELKQPKTKLRLVIKDDQGNPISGKRYELKIGDKVFKGNTDGKGFFEQQIPAEATKGTLKVFTENEKLKVLSWELSIGELEPVDTNLGIQGRLRNLAFYFGTLSGKIDTPQTKDAIKNFKKKNNLDPNENVDDALRSKLRDSHDKKA